MKKIIVCILCIVVVLTVCAGCAQDATGTTSASATASGTQQPSDEPLHEETPQASETQNAGQIEEPQSTTLIGEWGNSAPVQSSQPEPSAFDYDAVYEGDGYSFHYPTGTQAVTDEETTKSFLLPGQQYTLNVTRFYLSGQQLTVEEAFPVYRKTLEQQGNAVTKVGTAEGIPFDHVLMEGKLKDGDELIDSVQIFLIADGYNYTFTISSKDGDPEIMAGIVVEIAGSLVLS